MRTTVRKALLLTLGWTLIVLGVAGLFLPLLQGILFLVAGLLVLSRESAAAHRLLERLRGRHPRFAEWEDRARAWGRSVADRFRPRRGEAPRERDPAGCISVGQERDRGDEHRVP